MAESNNVVQEIQELIAQTKYKEAAELAEKSIKLMTKQSEQLETERNIAMKQREDDSNTIWELTRDVKFTHFSYSELQEATNDFDDLHEIGKGRRSTVYKGTLRHGTPVAIKKLNSRKCRGEKEFNYQVEVLSKINHPNLVSLIGVNAEAPALICELVPNGSLEEWLRNPHTLSWENCINIASGICSALVFLHSQKPNGIIHGNIHPGNVLLDSNFNIKLSDFGMFPVMERTDDIIMHSSLTLLPHSMSLPYMAPEYFFSGETPRSDIYSFGMVLLRILTGKGPRQLREEIRERRLDAMLDGSTKDWPKPCPKPKTKKLLLLGLQCCHEDKNQRPDLEKDVWSTIESMKLACRDSHFWWSEGSTSNMDPDTKYEMENLSLETEKSAEFLSEEERQQPQ